MRNASKKKTPIVSIITPSYNQGEFIEETIKSVLSQEGDFIIDFIIVDGKSIDNSIELIKKYHSLIKHGNWSFKCKGIKYRWVSESDKGQADAINKGFKMAEGGIVAWLNSDDTYLPDALYKIVAYFKTHPDSMVVYGKTYYVEENGEIVGKYPTEPFDFQRLAVFNFICQPSTFFRKEVLAKYGGLNPELHYSIDYDFWVRMAEKVSFNYLPEFLSTYRLHCNSKTISPQQSYANNQETLMTVMKYYKWAPANRVYCYSYHLVKNKLSLTIFRAKPTTIIISLFVSLVEYLKFNKRIRMEDIKMINMKNIRKIFMEWIDIIKEI